MIKYTLNKPSDYDETISSDHFFKVLKSNFQKNIKNVPIFNRNNLKTYS